MSWSDAILEARLVDPMQAVKLQSDALFDFCVVANKKERELLLNKLHRDKRGERKDGMSGKNKRQLQGTMMGSFGETRSRDVSW